jgi:hypothetical protein
MAGEFPTADLDQRLAVAEAEQRESERARWDGSK